MQNSSPGLRHFQLIINIIMLVVVRKMLVVASPNNKKMNINELILYTYDDFSRAFFFCLKQNENNKKIISTCLPDKHIFSLYF